MCKPGSVRGWLLLSLIVTAACEQELSIPPGGGAPDAAIAGAADEGFTGTAGAPDAANFAERLPTVDAPVYTHFGGASDDGALPEAAPDPRQPARGGSAGADAASPGAGGASGGSALEPIEPPQLLLSEYVEGSSKNKALEIYALADSVLDGCEIRTFANGKSDGPARITLHGHLDAGQTQVLCTSALLMTEPSACDVSANLMFNGNDALELVCDAVVLDSFGQIGVDPGAAWGDGATVDHTLRRRCSVSIGALDGTAPFDPTLEWSIFPADTLTGLGEHDCTAPEPEPSP